jgi:DNA-binding LacI/PurR family transcriptional regulator/biotin operon repressor
MAASRKPRAAHKTASPDFARLDRPSSLAGRVEQLLRQAIAEGRFPSGRLPTEVELAAQLGVSRETVRLAAEALQREGLLVKVRRKGTFLESPRLPDRIEGSTAVSIGYLQAGYLGQHGQEEGATRVTSALMLQGALEEAAQADMRLVVIHALHTEIGRAWQQLDRETRLSGVIFASYGEEKLLRRVEGRDLPTVLLDHDLTVATISSVRDDSFAGAQLAVRHLVGLGHRRIVFANWRQTDLNPWRLQGYRHGLRAAGLPRRRRWEISVELTLAGACQLVEQFLSLSPRPTAVYCFNNTLAKLTLEMFEARAIRVPQDVSVFGGGGEDVRGLTCHQADWHALGRTAVQVLLRRIAAHDHVTAEHHTCPHTLLLGQSTGPPG